MDPQFQHSRDEELPVVQIAGLSATPRPACPLGHNQQPRHLWIKNGFDFLQCPRCKLAWVDPLLTDESVSKIYSALFTDKLQAHPRPASFLAYRPLLRKLAPYRQTDHILDVGCFTGNFLLAARDAGWGDPQGTEISAAAVEHARDAYNLVVHHGDLLTLDLPAGYYDAVTLLDVIEHVTDPAVTIQRIYSLLRPGGVLYLNTPHLRSLTVFVLGKSWSVFFPWHRTYFSVPAMREMLGKAGFRLKQLQTVGVMPFSRHDQWATYIAAAAGGSAVTPASQSSALRRWVKPYRKLLRPLWLAFKRATELPFALLSRLGLYAGATLIVIAEKPTETS